MPVFERRAVVTSCNSRWARVRVRGLLRNAVLAGRLASAGVDPLQIQLDTASVSRYLVARLRSQGGGCPWRWAGIRQHSAPRQQDQRFGAESSIEVPAAAGALAVLMQIQGNPETPDANRF